MKRLIRLYLFARNVGYNRREAIKLIFDYRH